MNEDIILLDLEAVSYSIICSFSPFGGVLITKKPIDFKKRSKEKHKRNKKLLLKLFTAVFILLIGLMTITIFLPEIFNPLQAITSNSTLEERNKESEKNPVISNNSETSQSSISLDLYRKQVGDIVMAQTYGVSDCVPLLIDEYQNRKIDSSLAVDQLKTGKSIFQDSNHQLKTIQPPAGYGHIHVRYLKSMEQSQIAIDYAIEGINTSNPSKFNLALKNLDEANNLIYQTNQELFG